MLREIITTMILMSICKPFTAVATENYENVSNN